jgi:hypothetical protein
MPEGKKPAEPLSRPAAAPEASSQPGKRNADREARLAQALRENLKRRKDAQRKD